MISEAEALGCIASVASQSDRSEAVPLIEANGRVAAQVVLCQVPMPRFRSGSVDGYALCGGAHRKGEVFRLIGEQAAGLDQRLKVGEAKLVG